MKSKTNNSLLIYKKIIKLNTEELSAKNDNVKSTVVTFFQDYIDFSKWKLLGLSSSLGKLHFSLSQNKSKQVFEGGINE